MNVILKELLVVNMRLKISATAVMCANKIAKTMAFLFANHTAFNYTSAENVEVMVFAKSIIVKEPSALPASDR